MAVTLMSNYLSGSANGAVADTNSAFHDPFSSDPDAPRPYTHQVSAILLIFFNYKFLNTFIILNFC